MDIADLKVAALKAQAKARAAAAEAERLRAVAKQALVDAELEAEPDVDNFFAKLVSKRHTARIIWIAVVVEVALLAATFVAGMYGCKV